MLFLERDYACALFIERDYALVYTLKNLKSLYIRRQLAILSCYEFAQSRAHVWSVVFYLLCPTGSFKNTQFY